MGAKKPVPPPKTRKYFMCENCGDAFYSFQNLTHCHNCKKPYEIPTSPPAPPKEK